MSDSEDDNPAPSGALSDLSDDSGPSTSWGLKKRNKCPVISDSDDDDDDDDIGEEVIKDDGESGDSDSSSDASGAKTCAICLGHMRGEVGSPDACEHTFCKFCLLEWAKNNPTCPQDRIPFTLVLVRKALGGPIDKEIPVPKAKGPDVYEFVEENPTYCEVCNECDREDCLLLCDGCDLGYHLDCLDPPLSQVPVDEWFCPVCAGVEVSGSLSSRGESSGGYSARIRRISSRSGRPASEQQEPRIPRTRATERIRARIQKKKIKKRLKRKRSKARKKARVASGEEEDTRAPVTQFSDFKYFVEGDNDVDAANTEDKYAEQLLAGANHETARLPSQRKADAAKRLRDVAFIPQASYSGRVKTKIINLVNNQSEDTGSDLLSGILENQAIAFSSSKKLLLTNERKLTKQPDAHINCDIFQENSVMCEPLPSQRKTPERSDRDDTSGDNLKSDCSKESKEGNKKSESGGCTSKDEKNQSPSRSSNHHSSNFRNDQRRDYSHSNYNSGKYDGRRGNEHDRYGYHNRMRDSYHGKYSSHNRHSSSSRRSSPHRPSSSSYGNDRGDRWNKERDYRSYGGGRYERHGSHQSRDRSPVGRNQSRDRSPHNKNKSSGKESWKERSPSPSSRSNRSHVHRSQSSRSYKSHSKSGGKSSHSSVAEGGRVRSQWSFSYFNASDNVISKNNSSSKLITSSARDESESKDIKCSNSKTNNTASVPQERLLEASLKDQGKGSKSISGTKSDVEQEVPSQGNTRTDAADASSSQSQERTFDTSRGHDLHKQKHVTVGDDRFADVAEFVKKDEKCSLPEEHVSRKSFAVDDGDKQDQKSPVADGSSQPKEESKMTGKNLSKSSVPKKTKISALFGDTEDDKKEDTSRKRKEFDDNTERPGDKYTKATKVHKRSKSKALFGYDSDDNTTSRVMELSEPEELGCSKIYREESNDKKIGYGHHRNEKATYVYSSSDDEYKPLPRSINGHSKASDGYEKASGSQFFTNDGSLEKDKTEVRSPGKQSEEKVIKASDKYHIQEKSSKSSEKYCSGKRDQNYQEKHNNKENEKKLSLEKEKCQERHNDSKGKETKSRDQIDREKETKSHEKHGKEKEVKLKEKPTKGKDHKHHEKDSDNKEVLKPLEKGNENLSASEVMPEEKHCTAKNSHRTIFEDVDFLKVEKERNEVKHCTMTGADNSKNNGIGKKSASKLSKTKDEYLKTSVSKDHGKKLESTSKHKKGKEIELETNRKADSKIRDKPKHKVGSSKQEEHKNMFGDLFGDIDDISNSSSSLPEDFKKKLEDKHASSHLGGAVKSRERRSSSEVSKPSDLYEEAAITDCSKTSAWILDRQHIGIQNEIQNRDCETLCGQASQHKANLATKQDNDLRIKQQKAALEVKVVQEVKKSLDPYYRSKSITKDEYKQIVAKCVKKVVSAECGDVIEPGKMHTLVLGYIKLYKHRQTKSHT